MSRLRLRRALPEPRPPAGAEPAALVRLAGRGRSPSALGAGRGASHPEFQPSWPLLPAPRSDCE